MRRETDEVQKPLCSSDQQEVNHLAQIYGNLMRNVVFILLLIFAVTKPYSLFRGTNKCERVRYFTETKDVTPAGLGSSTGDINSHSRINKLVGYFSLGQSDGPTNREAGQPSVNMARVQPKLYYFTACASGGFLSFI